ncbi:uncharacterized protein LOC132564506 [Ylistrum balloti]|uniref:uncharacterized protein LOC132544498 n=1 Tax=Ylistrum balloti TaxID=509963 RepID=UPI002905D414|nr:uncharacterized protein LOC132544498 [Ylistrum balloti]XP_060076461.1 uncharacterized protein LOC132556089 [Ylistrum balloti]XP_060080539.1 uncharacterized protein LOC132559924 [Ylistrum balloti]XP_060082543.1 uncharacterized protein LOC132561852 [Ylistrum balloti]XP_060085143.1 uncharacterized protein LOC132564506 [Ylistrum balloti]
MVKTKTTHRKEQKCPMCAFTSVDIERMKEHILMCGLKEMEKKSFVCEECPFATTSASNLLRHTKRRHSVEQTAQPGPSREGGSYSTVREEEDSWKDNDPGDLASILGDVSDSDNGEDHDESAAGEEPDVEAIPDPTVRKHTRPDQVFTPKRAPEKLSPKDPRNCIPQKVPRVERPPTNLHQVPRVSKAMASVSTQTKPVIERHVVWKTTRYTEGDREIELVEMHETETSCGVCGLLDD